jgi:hypothetical protein
MSDPWRDHLRPFASVAPARDPLPEILAREARLRRKPARRVRLVRPARWLAIATGCVLVLVGLALAAHSRQGAPPTGSAPPHSLATFTSDGAEGYRIQLHYPASWHAHRIPVVQSRFSSKLAYLTSMSKRLACMGRQTASCHVAELLPGLLSPNGVLVSLSASGSPTAHSLGNSLHTLPSGWVAHIVVRNHATIGPQTIGNWQTITATMAPASPSHATWTLFATLRGPNLDANYKAVMAMINSIRPIKLDQPSACAASVVHYDSNPTFPASIRPAPYVQVRNRGSLLAGHLFYYPAVPAWQDHLPKTFQVFTNGVLGGTNLHMKILWTLTGSVAKRGLTVRGVNQTGKHFTQFYPGGSQMPSYLTVPSVGCWRLNLDTGTLHGTLIVKALPNNPVAP